MPMDTQIKIEHILEKGSGRVNEDRMVMGKNLFGVFDGATSLDNDFFDDTDRSEERRVGKECRL